MSRIGNRSITLPKGVTITLQDSVVHVKGPKGELSQVLPAGVGLIVEGPKATLTRAGDGKQQKADHGLSRALTANLVRGVSVGFERVLEVHGVGFKAELAGKNLVLALGFSHPIEFPIPKGLTIEVQTGQPTKVIIKGIDKQAVGQAAATIRAYHTPDSYKGKGVRYQGEYVRIKAGKSAA
jgi:large subunit ribosomal protein L6